jgi:hypothetical protein
MAMDKTPPNDPAAKRRLDLDGKEDMETDETDHTGNVLPTDMVIAENFTPGQSEPVDDKDRKKRTKKDGANSSSLGSAASLEESIRSQ